MQPCIPISVITPFPQKKKQLVDELLCAACEKNERKIIVLDDDPTGVQTVHDVSVYTDWSEQSIIQGFTEKSKLFFILTNSRSFSREQTLTAHKEIIKNINSASKKTGMDFIVISRGDSTLRGHYPLETEILREGIEKEHKEVIDGEIICPFFSDGGRFTMGNVHYVRSGDMLIPAAQTEFAKDKAFGYIHSDLCEYTQEKTNGKYKAENAECISIDDLRELRFDKIEHQLLNVDNFRKIIVNATDDYDVKVFCIALYHAIEKGKHFCMRTAASFVKAFGGISSRSLLSREEMIQSDNTSGGIVVVGSHTHKTTEQFESLCKLKCVQPVELHAELVFTPGAIEAEAKQISEYCSELILKGKTPVVYTTRTLISMPDDTPEQSLIRSVTISNAVQQVVSGLTSVPAFVVAKGGITSSDIGTKALAVKRATVLGQICLGIPVWKTGEESRFPDIPYIIFPGNVGEKDTLREAVEILSNDEAIKGENI